MPKCGSSRIGMHLTHSCTSSKILTLGDLLHHDRLEEILSFFLQLLRLLFSLSLLGQFWFSVNVTQLPKICWSPQLTLWLLTSFGSLDRHQTSLAFPLALWISVAWSPSCSSSQRFCPKSAKKIPHIIHIHSTRSNKRAHNLKLRSWEFTSFLTSMTFSFFFCSVFLLGALAAFLGGILIRDVYDFTKNNTNTASVRHNVDRNCNSALSWARAAWEFEEPKAR